MDHYDTVVSLSDFSTLPEEARWEMELMHEALTLNPVGRGSGFGCMREVIGALTEVINAIRIRNALCIREHLYMQVIISEYSTIYYISIPCRNNQF